MITNDQLQSAERQCQTMLQGFRSRKLARTFKEFRKGNKKLLYIGPRLLRNMWMLIKEVKRLRQEREQMVSVLRDIAGNCFAHDVPTNTHLWERYNGFIQKSNKVLKQVGELE